MMLRRFALVIIHRVSEPKLLECCINLNQPYGSDQSQCLKAQALG